MAILNDETDITSDNRSKLVTNFSVKPLKEGFDLWLFHATSEAGGYVKQADIMGTWHFESVEHLDKTVEKIKRSLTQHGVKVAALPGEEVKGVS